MYYHWLGDELVLCCRVQPKASKDSFGEPLGNSVRIYISAPPIDGKANRHLIKFLSRQFKTPQSNIRIESGANGRNKRVRISMPRRLPTELQIVQNLNA